MFWDFRPYLRLVILQVRQRQHIMRKENFMEARNLSANLLKTRPCLSEQNILTFQYRMLQERPQFLEQEKWKRFPKNGF